MFDTTQRRGMNGQHPTVISGVCALGALTLQSVNVTIAILTGLCGLIVILPKAIETLKRTKWRTIFRRESR